MPDDSQS